MENSTIRNLGKLYRLLDEACSDTVNSADYLNATLYPVQGVMLKIALAHKLHKMTPELDNACGFVLQGVALDDVKKSYARKAISVEQQGVFQLGYMSPDYKRIGMSSLKIKQARENAGLSIRALSEKTRLSTATIQFAESGKSVPKMSTLEKIASACDVSIADLQGDGHD